jgi:hypothetical protein
MPASPGAIVIDRADYQRLTGDGASATWPCGWPTALTWQQVQAARRRAAGSGPRPETGWHRAGICLAAPSAPRSLRIFDRSFAVTYWLQAVAIGIGLFGVAASFSAQVLARRKEFGLLAHLGLTAARSWPWWPAKARHGRPSARWPGCCWGWRWRSCWCTWSTRRAFTGPWTCRCLLALCAPADGAVRGRWWR